MSIQWLTGLEHGAASTNGGGLWHFANNASVVSTDKHTGSYSLYLNSTGATARIQKFITSTSVVVVQFFIKFPTSLPSAACQIFTFETGGTWGELFIDPADGKLYTGWGGSSNKHANALTTGQWYRIDVRIDTSANPNTFDYSIDGVAATQVTFNNPSQTGTVLTFGSSTSVNYQAYYDDIAYGNASGDYPLRIAGVELLVPTSDDTGNSSYGTNGIEINDGTDVNGTSVPAYDRLDSVPMTQTTRYLRQNGTGASENARVNFGNTTHVNIKAVMGVLAYFAAGTTANNGSTRVYRDSSNYTTIYSGDMSETSLYYKSAMVTLASNDLAGVNALQGDIGRSSDGAPIPYWAGLALEVAYGYEYEHSISLGQTRGYSTTYEYTPGSTVYDESVSMARSPGVGIAGAASLAQSLDMERAHGIGALGHISALNAIGLTRSGGLALNSAQAIAGAISLLRAGDVSVTGALGLIQSVALGRSASCALGSAQEILEDIALARGAGLGASPGLAFSLGILLGGSQALDAAGGGVMLEAIGMAREQNFTLGDSISFYDGISLGRAGNISPGPAFLMAAALSLGRSMGLTSAMTGAFEAGLSLGKSLDIWPAGGYTLAEAIALGIGRGVIAMPGLAFGESVELSLSAEMSATGSLAFYDGLTLGRAGDIGVNILALYQEIMTLERNQALETNACSSISEALALGMERFIASRGGATIEELVSLARTAAIAANGLEQLLAILSLRVDVTTSTSLAAQVARLNTIRVLVERSMSQQVAITTNNDGDVGLTTSISENVEVI